MTENWFLILAANLLVVIHFAFVLFVLFGGLMVWRWPRLAYFHLPAALWGAWIEFAGWTCPLTPLENWLRQQAGRGSYPRGFVEHYLLSMLYPAGLTRNLQAILGMVVIAINVALYTAVISRKRSMPRKASGQPSRPKSGPTDIGT